MTAYMHVLQLPLAVSVLTTTPTAAVKSVERPAFPRPADAAERHARAIHAVAAGDPDAFAQLYADYVRMVHAIVLGRVRRVDVDDLVQDVFLTAYTRLRELRDPAAFGGWLATIARNRATDHLRQSHEQVELPEELPGG